MSTPETPASTGGDDPGRGLSGVQRAGIVLGGLAVLLIVFLVLQGSGGDGGSSSSSEPQSSAGPNTGSSAATPATATGDSRSGSTSTSTSTAQPVVGTIRVVNGQPQGGIKTIAFKKGDQVGLKVQSDVADEIHVHGYDLKKNVKAGGSVQFAFKATIEGRFDIELEHAGTQIANLEVDPG
jgi:hypothetical protein